MTGIGNGLTAVDALVVGKLDSYHAATVDAVDRHLRLLHARLATAPPTRHPAIRHDLDLLLDHRRLFTPTKETA